MIKISPSILAADFSALGIAAQTVETAGADMLHIDVMDGHFVPNISLGPPIICSLRPKTNLFFDVHLMIEKPERYIRDFASAGADGITIHYEATDKPLEVLQEIHKLGKKAGISIKPDTPVAVLSELLECADMVLIMTVEPGFGGQSLIPKTVDKVREAKEMIGSRPIDIEVDGGVTLDNIRTLTMAGANVIVAGSAIFKASDVSKAIAEFREKTE